MAQDGQVAGTLVGARAALILAEGEVEHPTHLVLDASVAAHGVVERAGRGYQDRDRVARQRVSRLTSSPTRCSTWTIPTLPKSAQRPSGSR